MKRFIFAILIAFFLPLITNADTFYWGVNGAGLEFGSKHGTYNINYTSPTQTYKATHGFTSVRLPFAWERIQHTKYGQLDEEDMQYIDEYLNKAQTDGVHVLLDLHNYARYYGSVATAQEVADVWKKLAQRYKGKNVWYGIMNEPYNLQGGSAEWFNMAQVTIDAIRSVDPTTPIVIGGYQWSGAWTWQQNSDNLKNLRGSNLIFEAHQYFDQTGAGVDTAPCVAGGERMSQFIQWLRTNNKKGLIGEFATGTDPNCLDKLRSALSVISSSHDVLVGAYYWSAGPWWGGYKFSVESPNAPQMQILRQYMKSTPAPVPAPTPTPAPQPVYSDQLIIQKLDQIIVLLTELQALIKNK